MRAVILAAGRGSRLARITGKLPKCLARVGDRTLIERQIGALARCGITEVVVVTGHGAPDVRRSCESRVEFVHNARHASTNSLYSLWLARPWLAGGFIVLNCDVLFHDQLLVDLLTCRYEDALLASSEAPEAGYSDEEMKLRVRAGCVVEIAKTIPAADADGENIGIAKFGATGAVALVAEMSRLVMDRSTTEWVPAAFNSYCRRRALHVVDNRGFPWIEIDSPEDYWRACAHVLPALDERAEPARPIRERTQRDSEAAAAGSRYRHV